MKQDKQKTKVLFLIDKPADEFTGKWEIDRLGVFAFFPEEMHDKELNVCYAHVGQHSSCHPDYAKECVKATQDQYNDLKIELESIGYNLEILN